MSLLRRAAAISFTAAAAAAAADLQSAGTLAFGPDGTLLVGDSAAAAVFALDTADRTPARAAPVEIRAIDAKIAALLGASADNLPGYPAITAATYSDQQEIPTQKVPGLQGVIQLEKFDDRLALLLAAGTEGLDLRSIPLP